MSEKKSNSQKSSTESASAADKAAVDDASAVKQKLFILKAKAKNLKNAEQFLKNRDFEVISTTDMKIAISTILSGQASVIMLSTDHANPKVMKLPQIIQQSFNTPIIIFSEGVSQKGTAALRETRHPYILYPPVSGPAVERMILKIERDRKEKAESALNGPDKALNGADANPSTMKFSGQNGHAADDVIMQSKRAEQEIARMFSSDGGVDSNTAINDFTHDSDSDHEVGGFAHQDSSSEVNEFSDDADTVRSYLNHEDEGDSSTAAATGFGSSSAANAQGEIRGPGHKGTHRTPGAKGPSTRQQDAADSETAQAGFSPGFQSSNSETDSAQKNEAQPSGLGLPKFVGMNRKGDVYLPPQNEPGENTNTAHLSTAGAPKQHALAQDKKTPPGELSDSEILAKKGVNLLTFKSDDNASFLIKGTKHALENSAKFVQGKNVSKIQACAKVGCFNIESSKFSGCVIVAFGEKDKIDEQFNKNIQSYLAEYLKLNGLEVKTGDLQKLNIKEVNFEEWSVREADFLMTSIHEGSEIALAFFPREDKEAPLEISARLDMAKMTIDEIKADEPIEFDVYIYLPANEKYVRYVRKNGVMYGKQKDRLKTGGHEKIHIRKESASDLSRYRVQNFLNDKIESFKRAKEAA